MNLAPRRWLRPGDDAGLAVHVAAQAGVGGELAGEAAGVGGFDEDKAATAGALWAGAVFGAGEELAVDRFGGDYSGCAAACFDRAVAGECLWLYCDWPGRPQNWRSEQIPVTA
jgi:hypothetical protein